MTGFFVFNQSLRRHAGLSQPMDEDDALNDALDDIVRAVALKCKEAYFTDQRRLGSTSRNPVADIPANYRIR